MVAEPLSIPDGNIRYIEWDMELVRTRDVSMLEGRMMETADFGTPYWKLSVGTDLLRSDAADDLDFFLRQASVGGQTVVAYDRYRQRPRYYGLVPLSGTKAIGGAFDGSATIQTITSGRQITVAGLPVGFVLRSGDLIEIRKSALARSLHYLTNDVTGTAGGTAVVQFNPPLNTNVFTTSSTVHFERPACVMILNQGWSLPKQRQQRRATFAATEAFFS